MGTAWIKIEHTTPDKPEIISMAADLGIDQDAVCGKCIRLWIWADQNVIEGEPLPVNDSFIDRLVHHPGFSAALRKVCWLLDRSGRLVIPNFERHNGHSAKNRALSQVRVKRFRNAESVTSSYSISPSESPPKEGIPEVFQGTVLDCAEFARAWADWCQHRREIRKPMKPTTVAKQARDLLAMGLRRAVAAIDFSISQGYTGIFERGVANGNGANLEADAAARAKRVAAAMEKKHDNGRP